MQKKSMVHLLAIAVALLVFSTSARADIMGTVYRIDGNLMSAGPLSDFPSADELGTFTAPGINFFVAGPQGSSGTLGDFLTHGGATFTYAGSHTIELTQVMSDCPGCGSSSGYSTLIIITGTQQFVNGHSYTLTHDDGVVMTIDGTPFINAPAPVSPTPSSQTFAGTTGAHSYEIDYIATNGNPEQLTSTTVGVPEASSVLLFSGMWIGLAGLFGRRLRRL